jgi:hypothetical protein
MSDQDEFDSRLAARFEQERRRHVPADPFVANVMRKIHAERRGRAVIRIGVRVAALVVAVIASPWLIAGTARMNAVLDFSLNWASAQFGGWVLGGALALIVVLAMRAR